MSRPSSPTAMSGALPVGASRPGPEPSLDRLVYDDPFASYNDDDLPSTGGEEIPSKKRRYASAPPEEGGRPREGGSKRRRRASISGSPSKADDRSREGGSKQYRRVSISGMLSADDGDGHDRRASISGATSADDGEGHASISGAPSDGGSHEGGSKHHRRASISGTLSPEREDRRRPNSSSTVSIDGDTVMNYGGLTIPPEGISNALLALAGLDPRRAVAIPAKFSMDRTSNSEAWVGQHVGDEAASPCYHCSKGQGPFKGKPCIVVEDYFGGSCAGCHYNSLGTRCSFRKEEDSAPGDPAASGAAPRLVLSSGATPRRSIRSSEAAPRRSIVSPARASSVLSSGDAPRSVFSPGPSAQGTPSGAQPALRTIGDEFDWQYGIASLQDPRSRELSRRRFELAIRAIDQVDIDERRKREQEEGVEEEVEEE